MIGISVFKNYLLIFDLLQLFNVDDMLKMHDHELDIQEQLVRTLLTDQCPQWARLPLESITSLATSHAVFRLGKQYLVRMPRIETAAASIDKEYKWVPQLASCLSIPISDPCFQGKPSETYPWPWLIAPWQEGHNPVFEKSTEYEVLAKDIAYFLNQLHAIPCTGQEPIPSRGIELTCLEAETRNAIEQLAEEENIFQAIKIWEQLLQMPGWPHKAVWVHGDLLPVNILIENNRLAAVIDFADAGLGDPACDLIIAWSLLEAPSRKILKDSLQGLDPAAWERSKAWALSIAFIILPYYQKSNPGLVAIARRMIDNVIADSL